MISALRHLLNLNYMYERSPAKNIKFFKVRNCKPVHCDSVESRKKRNRIQDENVLKKDEKIMQVKTAKEAANY